MCVHIISANTYTVGPSVPMLLLLLLPPPLLLLLLPPPFLR
jgi:hypothetical protein